MNHEELTLRNYFRLAYDFASLIRRTRWKRERLKEYRDGRVRGVVRYAYEHSRFYHDHFASIGLAPEDIKNVEDLRKLPVVSRREMQANARDLISDEYSRSKLRVASTSGSTGQPFFTHLSGSEYDMRNAKQLRPHYICGHTPMDKWVLICPPEHSGNVSSLQRFLRVYSPLPVSVFDDVSVQVESIKRMKPDVLDGYSSSLVLVAKDVEKRGVIGVRPRMCMCGAELFHSSDRTYVERVLGAPCFDQYGSEELGRIAWQCSVKGDYHIDFDTLVVEFLDRNGEQVAPGEEGTIVCTSLFNYAMPILRYSLGDVGVPCDADQMCECGRTFPLMKMIAGRSEDAIILPDGRILSPVAIGDAMCGFKFFPDIVQYRFVQEKLESLRVIVKERSDGVDDSIMRRELAIHLITQLRLPEDKIKLAVESVEEIPPDRSGKIRKVVSML